MTTASDLLAATNAAILKALTSQEYQGPGGRRQRMADLKELRQTRKELMDEVSIGSDGSMCSLLSLEGPSP
jgi:hypothetical protein